MGLGYLAKLNPQFILTMSATTEYRRGPMSDGYLKGERVRIPPAP
jgi:hypothetical protein